MFSRFVVPCHLWLLRTGFLASVTLVVLLATLGDASAQSNDAKLWTGFDGRFVAAKALRFDIEHQERLSGSVGVEKSLTELKASLRAHKYLRFAGAYRLIATGADGFWHRASGDIGTALRLNDLWKLSYRLRYQSTFRPTETVSSVRNKVGVDYELLDDLTPWAAFELHYSTNNSEFREARFVAGLDKKLSKRTSISAFYMFQSEFNKKVDENNHILSVGLTFVFRRLKQKDSSAAMSEDGRLDS